MATLPKDSPINEKLLQEIEKDPLKFMDHMFGSPPIEPFPIPQHVKSAMELVQRYKERHDQLVGIPPHQMGEVSMSQVHDPNRWGPLVAVDPAAEDGERTAFWWAHSPNGAMLTIDRELTEEEKKSLENPPPGEIHPVEGFSIVTYLGNGEVDVKTPEEWARERAARPRMDIDMNERDAAGIAKWGTLTFPWGDEEPEPQPEPRITISPEAQANIAKAFKS